MIKKLFFFVSVMLNIRLWLYLENFSERICEKPVEFFFFFKCVGTGSYRSRLRFLMSDLFYTKFSSFFAIYLPRRASRAGPASTAATCERKRATCTNTWRHATWTIPPMCVLSAPSFAPRGARFVSICAHTSCPARIRIKITREDLLRIEINIVFIYSRHCHEFDTRWHVMILYLILYFYKVYCFYFLHH